MRALISCSAAGVRSGTAPGNGSPGEGMGLDVMSVETGVCMKVDVGANAGMGVVRVETVESMGVAGTVCWSSSCW